MKRLMILLSAVLIVSGVLVSWAAKPSTPEGAKSYTPTRIEWLVMELNIQNHDLRHGGPFGIYGVKYFVSLKNNNTVVIYITAPYVADDRLEPENKRWLEAKMKYGRSRVKYVAQRRGWDHWVKVRVSTVPRH